jgi:membrane dipeptidase
MGDIYHLKGMETLACFPNITAALVRAGWEETRIRKVLGENWVNLLKEVWGT